MLFASQQVSSLAFTFCCGPGADPLFGLRNGNRRAVIPIAAIPPGSTTTRTTGAGTAPTGAAATRTAATGTTAAGANAARTTGPGTTPTGTADPGTILSRTAGY